MPSRKDIEAGRAYVRLFLRDDFRSQLARSLRAAGAKLQGWGRSTMIAGAGMTAAGTAILAPIAAAVKSFASQGDELDKMAKRTGVAAGALAELGFAAEQSGASLGAVEGAMLKMNRRLGRITVGQGSGQQVAAIEELGLSVEQLNSMNPEERFLALADAMAGYGDNAAAAGLAQRAFGTGVDKIIPLLIQGREAIAGLRTEARESGYVPTQEEIDNAAKVTDAINRVKRALKAAFFNIGASLSEPALKFLDVFKGIAVSVGKFVKGKGLMLAAAAAIGAALVVAGTAVTALGIALFGAGVILSALGAAVGVLLSPIGLITAAVVGGAAAWVKYSESGKRAWASLKAAVMPIIDTLKATFGGVTDALTAGDWGLAGKIAMTGLKLAILQGLSAIREAFPKTFGTVLRVFAKIGDGIVAVWNKVTGFLTEQWNSWGKQTLETVMGVASRIPQIWQQAVEGMANWMLSISAKGGIAGKAMSKVLGVDMSKEQARAEKLERERQGLGLGGSGTVDVLADAREAVHQYTESLMAGVEAVGGEPGTGKVSEGLDRFLGKLESGAGIDDVAKELAALRAEASRQAEEAKAEGRGGGGGPVAGGGPGGGLGVSAAPRGVALTATYSAAAARISGYQPGGPEKKMADGIVAIERNTAGMFQKLVDFLAGWRVP